jgi:hypothetical protein
MNQILVQRRPVLANQDFVSLCEALEANPRDEGAWRELFDHYLDRHVCIVIIKRTIQSRGIKSEYLAWVM